MVEIVSFSPYWFETFPPSNCLQRDCVFQLFFHCQVPESRDVVSGKLLMIKFGGKYSDI